MPNNEHLDIYANEHVAVNVFMNSSTSRTSTGYCTLYASTSNLANLIY